MSDDDKVSPLFGSDNNPKWRAHRREELRKLLKDREDAKQGKQDEEAMGVANSGRWVAPPDGQPTSLVQFVNEVRTGIAQINLRLSAMEKALFHLLLEVEVLSKHTTRDENEDGGVDIE